MYIDGVRTISAFISSVELVFRVSRYLIACKGLCMLDLTWMAFSHLTAHPLAFVLFSCGDVVLSCPLLCPHESSFPFFSVDLPPSYFWCFMTALLNKFLKLWDEFEIHWYLHPLSLFVPLFISFFLIFSLPLIPCFSSINQ